MKQVTKKTLGVATLGAALSVAGAGVASADVTGPLQTAGSMAGQGVQSVPIDSATKQLPDGAPQTLDASRHAVGVAGAQLPKAVGGLVPEQAQLPAHQQGQLQSQGQSLGQSLGRGQGQGQGRGQGGSLLGGLPVGGSFGSPLGG